MANEISVKMVQGLLGFEEITDYTLKPVPNNSYFFWLEAEDGPGFLVTKPGFFFPQYKIELEKECIDELHPNVGPIEVYNIITVPERTADMTANLLAPVFINEKEGLARQVVLHDTHYTTRHYLFSPERRRSCG
ncbi:flagellar assembly protein FliW [Candidatus Contubernalis alkaliaceticus]|uniref:flagellar assembly protein FliW n=1 Tax=Candidatus Contubernalis alkaliaceticus TaxID=338645 RepID=UPI001F4BF4A9|nr:flagellar assembly protein FliW [Candidatus Contubernalis alkalaceticus]UNC91721.1 flagellar assembly protein FliW [Candidatus Contubernalis alkalaceticus]